MAEIAVNFLLERLHAFLVNEAHLLGDIRPGIVDLTEKLLMMKAYLKDADRKRDSRETIKTWVSQVRRAAYDIEDVIDEFVLLFGPGSHAGGGIRNSLGTQFSTIKHLPAQRRLAKRIQEIKSRIMQMAESKHNYNIETIEVDNSVEATIRRWQDYGEANFLDEVVGIEKDVGILIDKLVEMAGKDPETCLNFISVVGMGGLGKTTLVRKVYNEPKLKEYFNCSAWVSVSQSFKPKDLLKIMLIEFCGIKKRSSMEEGKGNMLLSKNEINELDEDDLKEKLQKYLEGKRFILVLDDVWDTSAWDYIKCTLPVISNGSKIMITTRNKNVAESIGTTGNFIHELKAFPEVVAMSLLCRKAFPGSTMPPEFKEVCKSVLQRCGGIPLAIVALGGILCKKKTVSEWKKVNDNLRCQLDNDSTSRGSVTNMLKLSYNDLPLFLKPCFLYCALFPEDYLIERNKMIRLWVAEGFIKEKNGMTKEEVGEDYLMQLIDRSMLEIADTSIDGSRVKSCRVHDLMRDVALSISQEEEFSFKLDGLVSIENVVRPRRMSITGNGGEIGNQNGNNAILSEVGVDLRSLLVFNVSWIRSSNLTPYFGFRLLRVLDLEGAFGREKLPKEIGQLLHLRYLNLKGNGSLKQLPRSIQRLQNLETLNVSDTNIDKLPNGIVRLKNMRHLSMSETDVPRGIGNLGYLQTLMGLRWSRKGIGAEIGKLKELRRLEIWGVKEEDSQELYAAISCMTHLFRLSVAPGTLGSTLRFTKKLLEHPPPHLRALELVGLSELPLSLGSFTYLVKLGIGYGSLTEDPLPSLSSLPSLAYLMLLNIGSVKRLACGSVGFAKLKRLLLGAMEELETVEFEEDCMPSLKKLWIYDCPNLQMVPQGIQHLQLQELTLEEMPEDFVMRLKEGGEDHSKVQSIPSITLK